MKEQRDILDLLEDSDESLELTGGICNLLGYSLRIVDENGRGKALYMKSEQGLAYVSWCDSANGGQRCVAPMLHPRILDETEPMGSFNHGWIDLVRPVRDTEELVRFWRDASAWQGTRVCGLPKMKPWRKQFRDSCFCVVTVGVALTAYFHYEEIDMLLVPAGLRVDERGDKHYRGLMPAGYLLMNQPIRRR